MKYVKMLSLAAAVAAALMAFAASASATVLYSGGTKQEAGTEIKASVASGTSAKLTTTEGTTLNTCTGSTISGNTSNTGSSSEAVKGTVAAENLTWSGCTFTADTLEGGSLEVNWTSGLNGTLTAKEFRVTVNTGLFGSCVYTAGAGTTMGTLTGSTTGNATMDVNANVTKTEGNCPSSAKWVATYTVSSPNPLHVTAS